MVTSHSVGKGTRSIRTKIFEPQKDWDSFSLAAGVPKDGKETFLLPAEKTISDCKKIKAEIFI